MDGNQQVLQSFAFNEEASEGRARTAKACVAACEPLALAKSALVAASGRADVHVTRCVLLMNWHILAWKSSSSGHGVPTLINLDTLVP